jgi:hypothetical protein
MKYNDLPECLSVIKEIDEAAVKKLKMIDWFDPEKRLPPDNECVLILGPTGAPYKMFWYRTHILRFNA